MARIKVGLYHVELIRDPASTVRAVFEALGALPNDASRARTISEHEPTRPRNFIIGQDIISGEFTRIRAVRSMPLCNAAGQEDTLTFGPDDPKPSDHTAFLYDSVSSVLHIDEHANGVTHAGFARYIQAVGEFRSVVASPIIGRDAMVRFARQQTFSKITVNLAAVGNTDYLRDFGFDEETILGLINQFNAPKLKLEMSIDSRRLHPEGLARIRQTVEALLRLPSKQLKKLVVEGSEDGGDDFPVDLIKGRLMYEVNLDQEEIADADRSRAVSDAWTRNRDELRQRYGANNQQR